MKKKFIKQIATIKQVLKELSGGLIENCKTKERPDGIGLDSDSNFEIASAGQKEEFASISDPKIREAPFKAMVLFLKMYLKPRVNQEDFNNIFNNIFEVDDVRMKKNQVTYVLFEKSHNPALVLEEETFKMLTDTNMFRSTETIFNIKIYVQEFLRTLDGYEFQVTEAEYEKILKVTKEKFESRIVNCPYPCPSCGKFCEKEIHPHGGKCRIMTGHQICSMGGKVWNTNEDKTAILLMCEDYNDDTQVLIPGQNMEWGKFKEKCGDQWDWTLPMDQEYVTLQEENRDRMKNIWNKFGREILKYYGNRGTHIAYIPYTSPEEIYGSLFLLKYYVCFVIDGTNQMPIEYIKKWVSDTITDSQLEGKSKFRVIVYHGHDSTDCVEKFPNGSGFTSDAKSIQGFLENITTYGNEKNEFAMLHGLATAGKESDWKLGFGIENIIAHYYVEPTNGCFDIFAAQGKCDRGCLFDWKEDINDRINKINIQYKRSRLIPYSHPEYISRDITCASSETPSGLNLNFGKKFRPKTQIFIDYKTEN